MSNMYQGPSIRIHLGNLVNKSQDWRTLLNWIKQFTPIWSGFPGIQTELAFPLPPPSGQALPARVANLSGPSAGPAGPSGSSALLVLLVPLVLLVLLVLLVRVR
jgi:hypothetical protein